MEGLHDRNAIIEDFFALGGNYDRDAFEAVMLRLQSYVKANGSDSQLDDIAILLDLYKNENERKSLASSCKMAEPLINKITALDKWSFYDLRVLGVLVGFAKTYKDSHDLVKLALSAMREYEHEEKYLRRKLAIHGNFTTRLLRSRYFEEDENKYLSEDEFEKAFNDHINEGLRICQAKNLPVQELFLRIKKGVFDKDYDTVDKYLDKLKEHGKGLHELIQGSVNEYNVLVGNAISTHQFNIMVGRNIRAIRKFRKMSTDDFAHEVGVSPTFINQVERGEKGISCHNLYKIANILDVKYEMLFQSGDISTLLGIEIEAQRHELFAMLAKMEKEDLDAITPAVERISQLKTAL